MPIHPGHEQVVVRVCGDDAGDGGAVAVIVQRIVVVIYVIVSGQDAAGELRQGVVEPGIENGHDDVAASGSDIPGLLRAQVLVMPLPVVIWVVRRAPHRGDAVRFGEEHFGILV